MLERYPSTTTQYQLPNRKRQNSNVPGSISRNTTFLCISRSSRRIVSCFLHCLIASSTSPDIKGDFCWYRSAMTFSSKHSWAARTPSVASIRLWRFRHERSRRRSQSGGRWSFPCTCPFWWDGMGGVFVRWSWRKVECMTYAYMVIMDRDSSYVLWNRILIISNAYRRHWYTYNGDDD